MKNNFRKESYQPPQTRRVLFDIKPVKRDGSVDWSRNVPQGPILDLKGLIKQREKVLRLKQEPRKPEQPQMKELSIEESIPFQKLKKETEGKIAKEAMRETDFQIAGRVELVEAEPALPSVDSALKQEELDQQKVLAELAEVEKEDNWLAEDLIKRARPKRRARKRAVQKKVITGQLDKKNQGPLVSLLEEKAAQLSGPRLSQPESARDHLRMAEFDEAAFEEWWLKKQDETELKQLVLEEPLEVREALASPLKPKRLIGFLIAALLMALLLPGLVWFQQGLVVKDEVLGHISTAYEHLLSAQELLKKADWSGARQDFIQASLSFRQSQETMGWAGRLVLSLLEKLPFKFSFSDDLYLFQAGEDLSLAGQQLSSMIGLFAAAESHNLAQLGSVLSQAGLGPERSLSLSERLALGQANIKAALSKIDSARENLDQVEGRSQPALKDKILFLKEKLPLVENLLNQFFAYSEAVLEFLGHRHPRQYLLIFQNNSELRATGGFIGTYGLLVLDQGRIKKLFIDNVFNPDGQLREKIIPPRPIQKISTAWSMHDANWFADFPTSAQKIAWFYEKAGGPTVDGLISLTPTVIERLLKITGPIEMPDYQVVLTADNFLEAVQYEVEEGYDQALNRPKKILADFAPLFIEAINHLSPAQKQEALLVLAQALREKHILLYFNHQPLEDLIVKQGWAGQLLETDQDYLSLVSSNINGYKTDKVIKEKINLKTEIEEDGSLINTLTIEREHLGGSLKYDWWNRVNANYLRVYLPLGSKLISVQGQTQEDYQPPIDYQAQGFKPDPLVAAIEKTMAVDPKSGTEIFEESQKTVFGNWVYLSPGEKVVVEYRYRLPFKLDLSQPAESYRLVVQKQSGTTGSQFTYQLNYPPEWSAVWHYPSESQLTPGQLSWSGDLKTDRILGVTFEFGE